jgi:predicted transcriptional regulator
MLGCMKERCISVAEVWAVGDLTEEANLLKALAEPNRLRIFVTLVRCKEACVCEFTEAPPLLQPTVSHHLKVLKEARLIEAMAIDPAPEVASARPHITVPFHIDPVRRNR